jgi:hypothetical protein
MDEPLPEDIGDEAEARKWLGQAYDDAHAALEGKAVERLTTTEIDERLTEDLRQNNGKFQKFMELAGALLENDVDNEADAHLKAAIKGISRPSEKKDGFVHGVSLCETPKLSATR